MMQKQIIGILDSGGYNINSIKFAFERIGQDIIIVDNKDKFALCNKIVIPGVGNAKIAMKKLEQNDLIDVIKETKKTTLGICLGMQIMFEKSEEFNTNCIGIFNKNVIHLPSNIITPHMGWNKLKISKYAGNYVYFANNFYVENFDETIDYVDYEGLKISAIVKKDNFIGCQFHPEKSGEIGEKILLDFIEDNL